VPNFDANGQGQRREGPLRILWPHRWEHDKKPEVFFAALGQLNQLSLDFRLSVLGQSFSQEPEVFADARKTFQHRIDHWGFLESKEEYWRVLADADVVVSTADHEFFGVAVAEAALYGCLPILPRRLAYPELYKEDCLYNTETQLLKRLKAYCQKPHLVKVHLTKMEGCVFKRIFPSEKELINEFHSLLKNHLDV